MATRTANTGSNNWNTNGAWVGGVQPTAADDVVIPASAVVTVPASTSVLGRSLTVQASGTLAFAATTSIISLGDATAGAGNVAIDFSATSTITLTGVGTIQLVSTSATQQTISSGGKTMPSLTFSGIGGNYLQSGTLVQNSAATLIFTNGTFSTGNNNASWGTVTLSSANAKTVTLGSSTITVIGGGINFGNNSANFTLNAGTSSIVFNPTAAVTPTLTVGAGQTWYNVSVIKSAGGFSPINANNTGTVTFNNFTMDNTVLGGGNRLIQLTSLVTWAFNGTFTYKANHAVTSRGRLISGTPGLTATIDLGTTGVAAVTDIDFEDIAFTGTNTPVTAAGGSRLGDGGGNSGITFASPVTYYWIGNGGDLNNPAKFSTSSGGSAGSVIPLIHDTIVFDANSITSAGQTIVNSQMRVPGLDFTNVLNSPVYNPRNPNGASNSIYGSLILKTGMTISYTSAAGGSIAHTFKGRGTHFINQAGADMGTTGSMTFNGGGGSYTLQSDFVIPSTGSLSVTTGTFNANGYNTTAAALSSSATATRAINLGSGTMTLTSSGTPWQMSTMTNLTFDAGTSTVVFSDTTSTDKTIAHGGTIAFYNIEITGGGSGVVIFGSNPLSMNNLTVTGPKSIRFNVTTGSTTTIFGDFIVPKTVGNVVTLDSTLAGTAAFLKRPYGRVTLDYMSIKDITVIGGQWNAGPNSTNVSGNTGWKFGEVFGGSMFGAF